MLKKIFFLFFLTLFISKWSYDIGFRINFFYLFYIIIIFTLLSSKSFYNIKFDKKVFKLWLLKLLFILPIIFSFIQVFLNNFPTTLYFKGLFNFIFLYFPLLFILIYLTKVSIETAVSYLKYFVYGIVFMMFFSFFELIFIYFLNFDLTNFISSYFGASSDLSVEEDKFGINGIIFYRLSGFTSDPSQAALFYFYGVVLSYLPINYFKYFSNIILRYLLLFSIVLTFSGSVFSLTILFLIIKYFYSLNNLKKIIFVLFSLLFIYLLLELFSENIILSSLLIHRFSFDGTVTGHLDLNKDVFNIFLDNILGIGFNMLSIVSYDIYSAHNTFLQILVELSLPGILFFLIFIVYLIFNLISNNGLLNKALQIIFFVSILESFSHDIFLKFEVQFIIFFLFALTLNINFKQNNL